MMVLPIAAKTATQPAGPATESDPRAFLLIAGLLLTLTLIGLVIYSLGFGVDDWDDW